MSGRWRDCGRSFRALPTWVQVWVAGVLVPVNAAPFALFWTDTGQMGMVSSLLILASNVPIMLHARGMSRLMSVPHLLIWGPLCVWIGLRLHEGAAMGAVEHALELALFAANGVSLLFDVADSWRWWRGERDVPGSASHQGVE